MTRPSTVSPQTRRNWLVDAALLASALLASASGIYFLYFPTGGFQGGRNPAYGLILLFERHTWEDLHTWTGIAMILAVAIHLPLHWNWVVNMARRTVKELRGECGCMNGRGRFNLWLNGVVGFSFLLTAASGSYFLLVPGGWWSAGTVLLLSRTAWDLIHTWSGVVLIASAVLHFAIHWKWVTKVTRKMLAPRFTAAPGIANPQVSQNPRM